MKYEHLIILHLFTCCQALTKIHHQPHLMTALGETLILTKALGYDNFHLIPDYGYVKPVTEINPLFLKGLCKASSPWERGVNSLILSKHWRNKSTCVNSVSAECDNSPAVFLPVDWRRAQTTRRLSLPICHMYTSVPSVSIAAGGHLTASTVPVVLEIDRFKISIY